MVRSGPDAGQLAYVSEATGGEMHTRAALHPTGNHLYISSSIRAGEPSDRGIRVSAFHFDAETCTIGSEINSLKPDSRMHSIGRYYGLEMHPSGRFLYQTTESVQEIRFYRIGGDGALSLGGRYDVTQGGSVTCAQTRRLEIHPDGRTLYSNCNNDYWGREGATWTRADSARWADADSLDYGIQVWRIGADGSLTFLAHHATPYMDEGLFDPTVHPNGRWLYQPLGTKDPGAPAGVGAYVLLYSVNSDGTLRYQSSIRVDDPDVNGSGPDSGWIVWPSTVLIHPDETHAYVTLHDAIHGTHHIMTYRVNPNNGTLTLVSTMNTMPGWNHHGGVLATSGGRTFLYTFINDSTQGVLEQYEVAADHRLLPLNPIAFVTGMRDARHAVVTRR